MTRLDDQIYCDHCRNQNDVIKLVGNRVTCCTCLELEPYTSIVAREEGSGFHCMECSYEIKFNIMSASLSSRSRGSVCLNCVYALEKLHSWTKRWNRRYWMAHVR